MKKQNRLVPLILMAAGSLLILWAVVYLVAPGTFSGTPTPTAEASGDPLAEIARVSPEDAFAAYQDGRAIFLDVRDATAFDSRHITGAISMPLEQVPNRIAELDPQAWVIPY